MHGEVNYRKLSGLAVKTLTGVRMPAREDACTESASGSGLPAKGCGLTVFPALKHSPQYGGVGLQLLAVGAGRWAVFPTMMQISDVSFS